MTMLYYTKHERKFYLLHIKKKSNLLKQSRNVIIYSLLNSDVNAVKSSLRCKIKVLQRKQQLGLPISARKFLSYF